jgi:uncharacterized membrane protein (DUF4010 family)
MGVGLEREWSGHASGPGARFAGLRTFLLLGMLGGGSGLMMALGQPVAGAVLAGAGGLFAIVAYAMAVRRPDADLDGTTEAAAFVVIALGVLAGAGWIALAAGAGAVTVLALSEKSRLHWMVSKVEEHELRAALQFAVLALVVLPLLPTGPYLGDLAIRPRTLWALVLVFSGLNFAGYVARKAIGAERGYGVAGALGGLVSSTAVSLTFSRHSRVEPGMSLPLSRGTLAACTVMVVRVGVLTAALAPPVAIALVPFLLPAAAIGAVVVALEWRKEHAVAGASENSTSNPLRLWSAIKMAALFQAGMIAVALVTRWLGEAALYVTGALLGITDVDALTVSMTLGAAQVAPELAARVIAVGVIADTVFKLGLGVWLGAPEYRRSIALPLSLMCAGCGLALWLL